MPGTYPPGQGEPINVIISGLSSSAVLKDQETNGGLLNYYLYVVNFNPCPLSSLSAFCGMPSSFGFSGECLGQHSGSDQAANLGDGNGYSMLHPCFLVSDRSSHRVAYQYHH